MPGTVIGAGHNEQVRYDSYIPSLQSSGSEIENEDVNKCLTVNDECNEKKNSAM